MSFTPQTYTDFGVSLTALETRIKAAFDALPAPVSSTVKSARVSCPALVANANTDVPVVWPTAFADANYTVVVTLEDGQSPPLGATDGSLIRHILSKTASGFTVRVGVGPTAVPAGGFAIHAVATHD